MYDVLVIGAGPAGITSAIYAKRAGANVLLLYYGESNLEKATKIDNYYGFENGIDGKRLYQAGLKQAQNLEIEIKKEEVLNIRNEEQNFIVETEKTKYLSKTVIIATGNKKLRPNIKGIIELEGKGVSYCAICDGFFYRNKNVAVIGDGKFALSEAEELKNIAKNVTILTDGQDISKLLKENEQTTNSNNKERFTDNNIEKKSNLNRINSECSINNKKIKKILGEVKVKSIEFEDGTIMQVDGIFVALGEAGGVDFAKKMGVMLRR